MSVIPFAPVPGAPPDAAQRQQALFDWAAKVLKELGFADAIANASTVQELNRIVFDKNSTEVLMAIHDALHPAHGKKADCFAGYSEATLKRILKNRFDDMVKDRKKALLNTGAAGAGAQYTPNWTDNLKTTDKGAVRPILANLILFLRHHPDWQNVLAFDEFASQVVIRHRRQQFDQHELALTTEALGMLASRSQESKCVRRIAFSQRDPGAGNGGQGRDLGKVAARLPMHVRHLVELCGQLRNAAAIPLQQHHPDLLREHADQGPVESHALVVRAMSVEEFKRSLGRLLQVIQPGPAEGRLHHHAWNRGLQDAGAVGQHLARLVDHVELVVGVAQH